MIFSCIGYTLANLGICCRRVAGVADVSESPAEMTIRSYSVGTLYNLVKRLIISQLTCIVKSKCSFARFVQCHIVCMVVALCSFFSGK